MSCDFERDEVRAELVNSTLLLRAVYKTMISIEAQLERNRAALKRGGKVPLPPTGDETSHSPDTP